ncbi:metal-dependent hydrolase [Tuberibacillus sp. Marseille-P3662]|uniref:metal-dependent hydrolase n=1 Tax=Tuberibacillus sp. Marseille-P3662 TaxID=1965358 RepID=UPI000A1CC721|nr:metal-dependent hydrolase [Tuberibacillus sp. Marseille-P3662]
MDTGTHVVMGIGLYALTSVDPVVTTHAATDNALLFATIAASVIPDIDTVLKAKDNATYIRNHRGATHSIPATCLWPIVLTGVIQTFFPEANLFHIWIWSFLGVFLHVFVDIFNAYGTQALRPLTYKWIALESINIFDPLIFGLHIAGFVLWYLFAAPVVIFLTIYAILIIYYIWRIIARRRAEHQVQSTINGALNVHLSPTIHWTQYHMAAQSEDQYFVGELNRGKLTIIDTFDRKPIPENDLFHLAEQDENIAAFQSFSPIYRWEWAKKNNLHEIRFIDLRYLTNNGKHYPFVAIAHINEDHGVIASYTGWVYSEAKLQKKLNQTAHQV